MTNGIWAIVPVKRFALAKQRLRSVLSEEERARLAEAMLRDVLIALKPLPELDGIAVVTADPTVTKIGRYFGARVVADELEAGTNAAVMQGFEAVRAVTAPVAVIAADLPFATSTDIARALAGLRYDPIVLAPADTDSGTNLLAMRREGLIEPSFGERSFERHRDLARAANLSCGICRTAGLGRDIDRPGDLVIPPGPADTQTAALLEQFKIAARLNGRAIRSPLTCH
jgi:2-phospho-L-lactate guanylyltransferase